MAADTRTGFSVPFPSDREPNLDRRVLARVRFGSTVAMLVALMAQMASELQVYNVRRVRSGLWWIPVTRTAIPLHFAGVTGRGTITGEAIILNATHLDQATRHIQVMLTALVTRVTFGAERRVDLVLACTGRIAVAVCAATSPDALFVAWGATQSRS